MVNVSKVFDVSVEVRDAIRCCDRLKIECFGEKIINKNVLEMDSFLQSFAVSLISLFDVSGISNAVRVRMDSSDWLVGWMEV